MVESGSGLNIRVKIQLKFNFSRSIWIRIQFLSKVGSGIFSKVGSRSGVFEGRIPIRFFLGGQIPTQIRNPDVKRIIEVKRF